MAEPAVNVTGHALPSAEPGGTPVDDFKLLLKLLLDHAPGGFSELKALKTKQPLAGPQC